MCVLKLVIKEYTCYKNTSNPRCIDLILSDVPQSVQSACVIETGLSGFLMMTLAAMRKGFK